MIRHKRHIRAALRRGTEIRGKRRNSKKKNSSLVTLRFRIR